MRIKKRGNQQERFTSGCLWLCRLFFNQFAGSHSQAVTFVIGKVSFKTIPCRSSKFRLALFGGERQMYFSTVISFISATIEYCSHSILSKHRTDFGFVGLRTLILTNTILSAEHSGEKSKT